MATDATTRGADGRPSCPGRRRGRGHGAAGKGQRGLRQTQHGRRAVMCYMLPGGAVAGTVQSQECGLISLFSFHFGKFCFLYFIYCVSLFFVFVNLFGIDWLDFAKGKTWEPTTSLERHETRRPSIPSYLDRNGVSNCLKKKVIFLKSQCPLLR